MSTLIDHAERLKAVIDIAEVVGRYVELRRGGINLKGLCPFHREKTPSFTVSPAKGIFHCFGCGEGGDAIKFIQKVERVEWVDALRLLSQQYGLPMPERERGDGRDRQEEKDERERLLAVCEMAAKYFAERLERALQDAGSEASRYLARRRIDTEAVRQFGLGLSTEGWQDLLDAARKAGFQAETLIAAGLAINNPEKKRTYDRFRRRLMFPIWDSLGRPIAFGGRVYASDAGPEEPKYINSPETPLYHKGQQLYALHLAREPIVRGKRAVLMEGYMDVIRAHRSGFPEAIATCGTALTDEQAKVLRRFTEEVIFVYDGDDAGQKAMLRGTEVLLEHGFTVRVVQLPGDHDPDSFLAEKGTEAFSVALVQARPFLDHFLDGAAARHSRATPEGKVKIVEELGPLVRRVRNPIAATEYARRMADFLDIDSALLVPQVVGRSNGTVEQLREKIVAVQPSRTELPHLRDRLLLRLLLESQRARDRLLPVVRPEQFVSESMKFFIGILKLTQETGQPADYKWLEKKAETDDDRALLRALLLDEEPTEDSDETLNHLEIRLRRQLIQRDTERLRRTLPQGPGFSSSGADDSPDGVVPELSYLVTLKEIDSVTKPVRSLRQYFKKPGDGNEGQL